MPLWLLALLFTALVLYTDDYVIAGLLPEIAVDLGVTEGAAGQLITVFSLTVAVVAPLGAIATARWPRRRLLAMAVTLFIGANAAAALAPGFVALMALRIVAATAAALATPAIFAATAALAPPERVGRYIALVALGVTGSIAIGVPLGTWVGGELGWRWTFAVMALAGGLALAGVLRTFPGAPVPPVLPLGAQLRVLAARPLVLGFLGNGLAVAGSMMLLSYLAPFLRDLSGIGPEGRGLIFAASGVAGIAGLWLGGMATDRLGAGRALAFGIGMIVAVMALFTALWPLRPVGPALVVPLAMVWGGAAFWNSPAIQSWIYGLAGPVAQQAMGLNTSSTYLGVAAGGALGGSLLDTLGAGALAPVSAALGLMALLVFQLADAARTRAARTRAAGSPAPER